MRNDRQKNSGYYEIHRFVPEIWGVTATGVAVLAAIACGLTQANWLAIIVLELTIASALIALGWVLLGRMVVQVSQDQLTVSRGYWSWNRRSFDLKSIQSVRIRILKPESKREKGRKTFYFGVRGQRAAEILFPDQRVWLGTKNPQALKAALLQTPELPDPSSPKDQEPFSGYRRRNSKRMGRHWGQIEAQEIARYSLLAKM